MWRAALAAVREGGFVTVTSWNEFGEGTQIEPCVPHTVKDGEGIPNSMRDALGDYDMAFLLLAGLNIAGAALFLIARKPKLPGLVENKTAANRR